MTFQLTSPMRIWGAVTEIRPGMLELSGVSHAVGIGDSVTIEKPGQALIGEAPDNAPWLPAARSQLAAVQERLGIEPKPPSDAPGPSREDIEAAGQMTEQDRQAMIETMVAGLAERLTQSPDDFDGWMRLIRSYSVLGDTDKARDAIEQARAQFSADQNRLQALAEAEAALGDEGSLQ